MASLSIQDRLLHYFLAMGAQQTELAPTPPASLSLQLAGETVQVVILGNDTLDYRAKIVDTLLDLVSVKSSSNQIYLAAPRLFATTTDAEVFRSRGIGLILFDERRIEESVPAQSAPTPQSVPVAQFPEAAVMGDIANLKSMYFEMEKHIGTLRDDLKNLHATIGNLKYTPEPLRHHEVPSTEPAFATGASELPSFFANNPWVDVLSKRGREDGVHIAG